MKHKIVILQIITVFFFMIVPAMLYAQAPGFDDAPSDAPIDGGLSLLVAAGVGYGARKLKARRKGK